MSYKKNESQITDLQLVEIDQNKFAVQITEGNINVNLTKMAKPFGSSKRPESWLKTQSAKDYLAVLSDAKKIATADLVNVAKGGSPDEQGTWANDYRIAMRFAQLSPQFAIKVDEMLVNHLLNRTKPDDFLIPTETVVFNDQKWFTKQDFCKETNASERSFYSRMGHYPTEYLYLHGIWYISSDLCKVILMQNNVSNRRSVLRIKKERLQLSLF